MQAFSWEIQDEKMILKKEKSASEEELKLLLREFRVRNINIEQKKVIDWCQDPHFQEMEIGDVDKVDYDYKIEITYNKDLTKAFLTTYKNLFKEEYPSTEEIVNELNKNGVTVGIKDMAMADLRANPRPAVDILIAEGRKAENGKDAVLNFTFAIDNKKHAPKLLEDGSVDFYNTSLIENVSKDQLLVEKKPPTLGVDGVSVKGKSLPSKAGKNKKMPMGKNIILSDDGLKIFAAIDGMVSASSKKISVLPSFEVNGDVDFSTGNIEFVGTVLVKGNVKNGFSVKSGGDVEIQGNVEGGFVTAEGNVNIRNGVRGMKKSRIEAGGKLVTKFIENANIKAGDEVIVADAIMHSVVKSRKDIKLTGAKGLIVGGEVSAAETITCKNIGSPMATLTTVEVGVDPEAKEIFERLRNEYNDLKKNEEKSKQAIVILEKIRKQIGELPKDKLKLYSDLITTLKSIKVKIEGVKEELVEASDDIRAFKDSNIKVEENLYSGVIVNIAKYSKKIMNESYKVQLTLDGADVKISPME